MSSPVKYVTSTPSGSIVNGNVALGINSIDYGPSSTTGWYPGINPPEGKYVIYETNVSGIPNIYIPNNTTELIAFVVSRGGTAANEAAALQWIAGQSNLFIISYDYPNIITDGLTLLLDAKSVKSYPTTGSIWRDLSGNNASSSLFNGPIFNSQGYLDFDGTDDWGRVGGVGLSTTAYTKIAWFKPDTATNNIISGGSDGQHAFWMAGTSNSLRAGHNGAWDTVSYSPGNMTGSWWCGAVTFNTSTGWILYLNGSVVDTDPSTSTFTGGNAIRIAAYNNASNLFNGKISQAQVYNRVLSASEILQNYYQAPIVTDGLVFAVDAGNIVSYESGSTTTYSLTGSFSGSLLNGTSYSQTNGGVFTFDGTNDYIQIPYNNYWDTNVFGTATNFTISCWAKPNLFMNWDTLITKNIQGWYSSPEGASIWTDANGFQGVFSSGVLSNPAGSTVILSYATTNTQKWYHVCFTGDGTTLRLYVDGIQRATGLVASRTVPVVTASVGPSFGLRDYWNGQMTGMMFYTRGITAEEVAQNFTAQQNRFI